MASCADYSDSDSRVLLTSIRVSEVSFTCSKYLETGEQIHHESHTPQTKSKKPDKYTFALLLNLKCFVHVFVILSDGQEIPISSRLGLSMGEREEKLKNTTR